MKERQLNSTGYPIGFLMVLKTDHITGATGKAGTIALTISKNGGPFGPIDGASSVLEVTNGHGWYNFYSPSSALGNDRDTPGELKLHAEEATCDPYDDKYDIVQYDPFAAISLPAAERIALADVILTRDWKQTVISIGTIPARCLLQAMRLLRNAWAIDKTTGVLSVTAEDDSTTVWTMQTQSQADAAPIVGQMPTS